MDTINASLLLISFKKFKQKIEKKNIIAEYYNKNLSPKIIKQDDYMYKGEKNGRYVYPIIVNRRDKLRRYLEKKGIETKIFHLPLINKSPFYQKNYKSSKMRNAERLIKKIIILPLNEKLLKGQIKYITDNINYFVENDKL